MPRRFNRRKRKRRKYANRISRGPSLDYHKMRLTQIVPLNTNAATQAVPGVINSTLKCYNLKNDTYQQSITAGPTQKTGLNDVVSLYNLFDNYRVQYCKLTYIPKYDAGFANGFGKETKFNAGTTTCYICYDADDENLNELPSQLIQRHSAKMVSLAKPWTFTWKPKRLVQSTEAGGVILNKGWLDKDKDGTYTNGEVLIRGGGQFSTTDDTPEGTSVLHDFEVGELLIEYYVEFKNRR